MQLKPHNTPSKKKKKKKKKTHKKHKKTHTQTKQNNDLILVSGKNQFQA